MSGKPGAWPFLLALPALVVGALMLVMVTHGFRPMEGFGGAGLVSVGAGLIGLGLGRRGKKAVGVGVFVVGAGSAVATVIYAKVHDAEVWEQILRETGREKATDSVCQGKTIPGPALQGPRKVTRAYRRPDDEEYGHDPLWMPSVWSTRPPLPELPIPSTAEEVGIVACITQSRILGNSCSYEAEGGGGQLTISIYQEVDDIEVRDARTAAVLGTKKFEGRPVGDKCDESIHVQKGEFGDRKSFGASPDEQQEIEFVRTFVDPARP